jgi:hypothetical protein
VEAYSEFAAIPRFRGDRLFETVARKSATSLLRMTLLFVDRETHAWARALRALSPPRGASRALAQRLVLAEALVEGISGAAHGSDRAGGVAVVERPGGNPGFRAMRSSGLRAKAAGARSAKANVPTSCLVRVGAPREVPAGQPPYAHPW